MSLGVQSPKRQLLNVEVLEDLIRTNATGLTENSRSWIFSCPRCNKSEKLYMLKTNGEFVCWRCKETDGYRGRPEFVLRDITGLPLSELRNRLYGVESYQSSLLTSNLRDFWSDDETGPTDTYIPQRVYYRPDFYPMDHKWSVRGMDYLRSRGIDERIAAKYDLRYCPPDRRVIIPIKQNGVLFGWQARAIFDIPEGSRTPKIMTLNGLPPDQNIRKDHFLMFGDNLINSKHAFVTEGPFDGMKADYCGGNVVTMGKAISRIQLGLLENSGIEQIYIALDPDASEEIRRLARSFSHLKVFFVQPPKPYKDLGEMSLEGVQWLKENAVTYKAGLLFGRLNSF